MRRTIYLIIGLFICTAFSVACGGGGEDRRPATAQITLDEILADNDFNAYDQHLDSAPDEGCVKLKLRHIGPLRKVFKDSNYLHLQAGETIGIGAIGNIDDAWYLPHPLVEVKSCEEYYVDNLTHSYPYLVPQAAELLKEIGHRFNDSLEARGGGDYRIKVTSVLRTPMTVKRLRRVNRNATNTSAHQYGTTFDISYSRFICDSITVNRSFEDLKNLLGEILYDLREEGHCYVVFERKQSCFHVTARP
ncbi:MAG: hypothetical protein K2I89_09790 [Muribaculaceae bacterium]|nr:hypothetical protein [Muribaculaceae bacterium]